jgi:outer membrane receptor protein involved in Fe transport
MANRATRIALVLILFLQAVAFAQSAKRPPVKGIVLEVDAKGEFHPLVGANLVWKGTNLLATSNENGVFEMPELAGAFEIVVSYVGFNTDTVRINEKNELKIVLKSNYELGNVQIIKERASTYISGLSVLNVKNMSEKELFKAACCNLSESFETNPSIDVSYADAATGIKQISMLGLSGVYATLTQESMPGTRGISSSTGLGFTPGTWVESIQVTKGVGSVANGFEGGTGQINVELHKPESAEKLFLNGYVNSMGRSELNVNSAAIINKKWATGVLLHTDYFTVKRDMNDDHFLDLPTGRQYNFMNRWKYNDGKGVVGQFSVRYLDDERMAGETHAKLTTEKYQLNILNKRAEVNGKLGYVFSGKQYKSIGLQAQGLWHQQDYNTSAQFNGYNALQRSLYANLIYQSIISDTRYKFRTGLSVQIDEITERESINKSIEFGLRYRTEKVPGAFFEFTWSPAPTFSMIAGVRTDYHNMFGTFVTPRLHAKWDITDKTTLRASAGRGQRTANPIAENPGVLISNRNLQFPLFDGSNNYGLRPEVSWNTGISLVHNFEILYRDASFTVDAYNTWFQEQVIVDLYYWEAASIFNLSEDGKSSAQAIQAEFEYSPVKRWAIRTSYKYYNITNTFLDDIERRRPFVSNNRAFLNVAYETKSKKLGFDATLQYWGSKEVPTTNLIDGGQSRAKSPSYFIVNAQATYNPTKKLALYVGVENALDFWQRDLIYRTDSPTPNFDGSLVWGPTFGRMFYFGFRYRTGKVS